MDLQPHVMRLLAGPFAQMSLPHLKNLADVVVAFFYSRGMALREIASHLEGSNAVKHKLKRLVYFLDSVELDRAFWTSYVRLLFALPGFALRRRPVITLLLDATTLRDDFWVLAVCVSYAGRSIPVYLRAWPEPNAPYDYWARVRAVLREVKQLLPPQGQYVIVADRGFQGKKMWDLISELEWDSVIRINSGYRVQLAPGQSWIQLPLFDDGFYEAVSVGKDETTAGLNLAVCSLINEQGQRRPWFLATSLKQPEQAIDWYRQRMWIEETFKDLKAQLGWENYTGKLPQQERLPKCLALSSLSYMIQLSLGAGIELPPSELNKTSVLKRLRQLTTRAQQQIVAHLQRIISCLRSNLCRSRHVFA